MSQWSTLSSGPLASWESAENGAKARKVMSQWSTLKSGPLAPWEKAATRQKSRKGASQWTTDSPEKGSKLAKSSEKSRAHAPLAD